MKKKVLKHVAIILAVLLLLAVLAVGGYVLYIVLQYSRIEDNTPLEIQNPLQATASTGQPYSAITYNIGFGAYNQDYSFFMDSGVMDDGTPVTGKHARAQSREIVQTNTQGAIDVASAYNADFYLLQEVDVKADRSFKIDQTQLIRDAFSAYSSTYASNFHSAFLAYPLTEPHGAVEAGLLTLADIKISEATRRSFPVDTSFPTKFFDLDRCFALHRIPVQQGGELVLINTHMSAYDEGGVIRAAQLKMLVEVLEEEYSKGNWVVVGGDFNHALCGTVESFVSQQQVPEWVFEFDDTHLPKGFSVVCADNKDQVPTCRSSDIPYQKGVNYTAVIDGFIVSDNVQAAALTIDTDFMYSDHNPVLLEFTLQ